MPSLLTRPWTACAPMGGLLLLACLAACTEPRLHLRVVRTAVLYASAQSCLMHHIAVASEALPEGAIGRVAAGTEFVQNGARRGEYFCVAITHAGQGGFLLMSNETLAWVYE